MPDLRLDSIEWEAPFQFPQLAAEEVHVWAANLCPPSEQWDKLEQVLSADERDRARRFRFERDQRRFVSARGILRMVLSRYLNQDPPALAFNYSRFGKPILVEHQGQPRLHFNLAHSGEIALYAVTPLCEVGVDVEVRGRMVDAEGIARRFFSPVEFEALSALPPDQKPGGFFNCWTRKEAFLKATGKGLSAGLADFAVTLQPDQEARFLAVPPESGSVEEWTLRALLPAPNAVGALAIRYANPAVRCWCWPAKWIGPPSTG